MSRIKVLLFLLIVAAGVLALYKLFPPYLADFTFRDDMKNEVIRMMNANKSDDDIKAGVLKLAQANDLPVTEGQVHVLRQGKSLIVTVNYQVHIDFPGYPMDLDFSPSTTNSIP